MKLTNLDKVLTQYAKDFEDSYRAKVSNYRIADTIQSEVKVLGSTYQVILHLADYWQWIEEGRKPGKQPPPEVMLEFVKRKNIQPRDGITSQKSLAFLIGRKIGRDGIKPRRYLAKTQEEFKDRRTQIIDAFRKDIKEIAEGIFQELKLE